jgi:two-component system alkaline phosphatase synthesis response regulator PhoP
MAARILLVAGCPAGIERLLPLFATHDARVESACDGKSGVEKASQGDFELIVVDDLLFVCAELRLKGIDTSLLMLTEERVLGLRLGADDCVPRTCDSNELVARAEALLRRVPGSRLRPLRMLRFGDVEVNFGMAEVRKRGGLVSLTAKEFQLLQYLVEHRQKVLSRQEILQHVWEYDPSVSSRTIDVHIGWLRHKLEENPQEPKYIKTIRGRGYRFDGPPTRSTSL